jgi:hypothetical protein
MTIKEHCKEIEVPNHKCFIEIEKIVADNKIYLSAELYLEILHDVGLIRFNKITKTIILTEKGQMTNKVFEH